MTPNNNLSVLPWYTSIEQQNARKWWVYGRIYPLFTPAMFMLPFQIILDKGAQDIELVNSLTTFDGSIYTGRYTLMSVMSSGYVDVTQYRGETIKIKIGAQLIRYAFVVNKPHDGDLVQYATGSSYDTSLEDVIVTVPDDAVYLWVLEQDDYAQMDYTPASIKVVRMPDILSFDLYKSNGDLVGNYIDAIKPLLSIKSFDDYKVIVYTGQFPVFTKLANGQYYATLNDGTQTWYSEIFTVVNDTEPYLKIEWWDTEDFIMDAGAIVYKNPTFHNVLYLDSDLAKPEYPFEEEGETRDGFFFPIKQISEKHYRFKFFASEYLLDVMRFIRMSDYARITYYGQTYALDTFLITPEWEDNGDVASVEAEFDTATVAKKIGRGYIVPTDGDFNNDFNNDFDLNNNSNND